MSEHKFDYCALDGHWMVRCGTCGQNCCSGAYGTLEDGSECPDCKSAYDMQENPSREQLYDIINMLTNICNRADKALFGENYWDRTEEDWEKWKKVFLESHNNA